ncbi:MAG: 30S ribosomal protein S12 methylthiotransferase RimO [Deltaproteobacteria bacterium]|nr:30S ribosomal protein S12 methylthiotransferase RimO [Deltaproteobacteria bacterium]MCL5792205.1 30S ribosomal protein S12 methylthiotransferase RimO [Deltaproteobacteria bacterium]
MNKKRVSIIPLGCPKNDVDSELIAGAFKHAGYSISWDAYKSDTVIINTCAFVKDAIEESLDAVMQAIEAKHRGDVKRVVVTGCLPQRFKDALTSRLKEVDLFTGVNGFEDLPALIKDKKTTKSHITAPFTDYPEALSRVLPEHSGSAYIKISDGCNNVCSYCVIPFIKGRLKSRKIDDIVNEVKYLTDNGVQEINLVAQDTMNFGMDKGDNHLIKLLSSLEKIEAIRWIRLNYLHPAHINDAFINHIKDSEKILKYFDVPIQHISDKILKRMNRHTDSNDIKRVIEKINKSIKEPFLRTTVITGFPGETEGDFKQLFKFFNEFPFHRIGVFPYSREEPAPAANMKEQIPDDVIISRVNEFNEFASRVMNAMSESFVGNTYDAIVHGKGHDDNGITLLRPWFFAPEIDGYVMVYNKLHYKPGSFVKVKITDTPGFDLVGEPVNN